MRVKNVFDFRSFSCVNLLKDDFDGLFAFRELTTLKLVNIEFDDSFFINKFKGQKVWESMGKHVTSSNRHETCGKKKREKQFSKLFHH
jgi:hypothetical protein